ncbi:putative baseplate assembly protein [Micromonospora sp. DT81.3]|uniref:putative baseplate assembly protein n=1 Tax=Micromonospora sp. DT81.3 TaxID=3416523 RepID=UPI003CE883FA
MTTCACCTRNRSEAVRGSGLSNGIDYLEVVDGPDVPDADRQRILEVHLINPPSAELLAIGPRNVSVDGGVRVVGIRAIAVGWTGAMLTVRVDRPGDFSIYSLTLVTDSGGVIPGMDPRLSQVDFSFKIECPADFDCVQEPFCPPAAQDAPEIDYLARDYSGFRRLMLDRMSVLAPEWRERNPADLGVALVEALAYSADHVSYELDATGMESTLLTARRRTSARRHARLVDYRTHDGSNARTWVQIRAAFGQSGVLVPAGTQLLTSIPALSTHVAPGSPELRQAMASGPTVFETMHDLELDSGRNDVFFYTWGEDSCSLPVGATAATLVGHPPIGPDDVLVFVERLGPRSGSPADADPDHRHAVRLRTVDPTEDPLGGQFTDPVQAAAVPVTEITWHEEDALPFPLCLSARAEDRLIVDVSAGLGNIALADHGLTVLAAAAATVPDPDPRLAYPAVTRCCEVPEPRPRPARFALAVPDADLTMAGTIGRSLVGEDPRAWASFDPEASATAAMTWQARHVLPEVRLDDGDGRRWQPVRDLLASGPFQAEFVTEVEADGRARLRFGDGEYGMRPGAGTVFDVTYRRGTGPHGNVGPDSLAHVVSADPRIESLTNPVPARGGTAAESIDRTRQDAPAAFFVQERAVTPDDYATMAARHPQVQRAVATQRFTGSWHTIFLTVDRTGGNAVDAAFEADLRAFLERFRMAGHDLEIDGPRSVALNVVLRVCALPDYYRSDVAQAVLARLGRGLLEDGRPAFFHPDRFTFGQPVTLSSLLAAAHEVEGVHFVEPITFRRRGDLRSDALRVAEIAIGRLEIARLDNDPSLVENGTIELEMEGGR